MIADVTTMPSVIAEPRSEFVGRRRELAQLASLLGAARLVTLTGVGGVGKTRLAVRAVNDHVRATGVASCFIGFDGIQDPLRVPGAVIAALPLGEHSAREPLEFLLDALGDAPTVLVFDNCEHLIDTIAAFVDELLDAIPSLTIVATSRRRLDVDGEQVFPVPPMSLEARAPRPPRRCRS